MSAELSPEQKTLHFLSRTSFGPTQEEIRRVNRLGIRAYLDEVYLWYNEVPEIDASLYSNIPDYFNALLVKTPDANGTSVNTLEVRVAGDTVTYLVNDQTVHTMPKGSLKTDGLVGVRINHVLDVQVDGFALGK